MKHLLIIILALYFGYNLRICYLEDFPIYNLIILTSIYIFFFTVFTANFITDFKAFQKTKKLLCFSATFLGLFSMGSLSLFYLNLDHNLNKESLLTYECINNANGTKIDLKKDRTCIIYDYSDVEGHYYYGNYTILDSIIVTTNIKKNDFVYDKFYFSKKDSVLYPFKGEKIDFSQKFILK